MWKSPTYFGEEPKFIQQLPKRMPIDFETLPTIRARLEELHSFSSKPRDLNRLLKHLIVHRILCCLLVHPLFSPAEIVIDWDGVPVVREGAVFGVYIPLI
jgi:hypothetical protein